MTMQVIGHRGVAGLRLENSRAGFELAVELGLSAVELDVRITRDRQLVVCHDADIKRISKVGNKKIRTMTLEEVKSYELLDGSNVLTLQEAIEILAGRHIIIEVKDSGCHKELHEVIKNYPEEQFSIASFRLRELVLIQEENKRYDCYALTRDQPFDIIHSARVFGFNGVGLNYWLLNPLTYHLALKAGLKIYVYTPNNPIISKLIMRFYRQVAVCSDRPDLLINDHNKEY